MTDYKFFELILPFVGALLAIFVAPVISKFLERQNDLIERDANTSDILQNYSDALDSAWRRIKELEEDLAHIRDEFEVTADKLTQENKQLVTENRDLRIQVWELRQKLGEQ